MFVVTGFKILTKQVFDGRFKLQTIWEFKSCNLFLVSLEVLLMLVQMIFLV